MPIYEYKCLECDTEFEVMKDYNDTSVNICTKCASSNVRKLISKSSFILKGTGWYKTDYVKKEPKKVKEKNEEN